MSEVEQSIFGVPIAERPLRDSIEYFLAHLEDDFMLAYLVNLRCEMWLKENGHV
jgi:hypothetical protein